MSLVNPFLIGGNWYRANFHTHTTSSDGKATVLQRVKQYRKEGYDVLAITDHRMTNDVSGMSDKKMLVISGIEYHPKCPGLPLYHIVGLNVPHGFAFSDPDDARKSMKEVRSAGGESILAHPSWCGHAYQDFRDLLGGVVAMEVYNATCDRHGRASSASEWAISLDRGHKIPCVGTDDAHEYEDGDVFESWTWLKMPSVSVANVLKALRTGACYASCGPRIHDFRVENGKITVRCSKAVAIHLSGAAGQGRRRRAEPGKTITSFSLEGVKWPYVRAMVTDSEHRMAWSNPIFLK